ncbi:MAG: PorV/PorQ family protein [Lutibacter sp.]|nr:PorV/PorQ family protein [Lutibacter sp.]
MRNGHLFICLFCTQILLAQVARKYANEFLNIGVDAAAFGMGKAVVASSDNVNAIYWNPAGLTALEDLQGSLMHASYFEGIANYDHLALALPVDDRSVLGFSLIRFGVDDILNTTQLIDSEGNIDYNRISLFSAADYALNVAYARQLVAQELSVGINAKIIRRIIGDFADSWGFGLDAALQFERGQWSFGLLLRDLTTTFNTWRIDTAALADIQNSLPGENQSAPESTEISLPKAQLGVARRFALNRDLELLTELDLTLRFSQTNDLISSKILSIDPAFGLQIAYIDRVFLRAGIGNFQRTLAFDGDYQTSVQPNVGLGFHYNGIHIDYALTNIGSVGAALYSNIFSIVVDIGYFRRVK